MVYSTPARGVINHHLLGKRFWILRCGGVKSNCTHISCNCMNYTRSRERGTRLSPFKEKQTTSAAHPHRTTYKLAHNSGICGTELVQRMSIRVYSSWKSAFDFSVADVRDQELVLFNSKSRLVYSSIYTTKDNVRLTMSVSL